MSNQEKIKAIGLELIEEVEEINNESIELKDKYARLRSLLESSCKALTQNEGIRFKDLYTRLNYLAKRTRIDKGLNYRINTFRKNANNVLHEGTLPSVEDYLLDFRSICETLSFFHQIEVPSSLVSLYPPIPVQKQLKGPGSFVPYMRAMYVSMSDNVLTVIPENTALGHEVKVNVKEQNEEFNPTLNILKEGDQINLIFSKVNGDGYFTPQLLVYEPDFTISVSSIAECMKEYSNHPLNFFISTFSAKENTPPLLLGNAANLFLDELVNEKSHNPIVFEDLISKVFRNTPFEFATCSQLDDAKNFEEFLAQLKSQFKNIADTVSRTFPSKGIDRNRALLEPSFICEQLGLDGRLDYLEIDGQNGRTTVIELKSGKAGFPETDLEKMGVNHLSQAFLYQIMLQLILRLKFEDIDTYIFYSKYVDDAARLRSKTPYMAAIRKLIGLRNLVVHEFKKIADNSGSRSSSELIRKLIPEVLITNGSPGNKLIENYIKPQINGFASVFKNSSSLEMKYFNSFMNFTAREHLLSKIGDSGAATSNGASNLWKIGFEEKKKNGEILPDLNIIINDIDQEVPRITLSIPKSKEEFLPNFRVGDIIVLYERSMHWHNVTNRQVFKGTIEELNEHKVSIRLRHVQRNKKVLPNTVYAIERDYLDITFYGMYKGLYAFLQGNPRRKGLLLNQRKPEFNREKQLIKDHSILTQGHQDINDIVRNAKQANDYFLLVGPPGTGKTSIALRAMVDEFLTEDSENSLLLLSYTNRAVDEICDTLKEMGTDFIRIGNELSCAEIHRPQLLSNVLSKLKKRKEVIQLINENRVFVSTIASISSKQELFSLKTFSSAIIDEASQIPEPALIGLLAATNSKNEDIIQKFILIGDHKQLPAVVIQSKDESNETDEELNSIGIKDRSRSLFERLLKTDKETNEGKASGTLFRQGRMHPEIAVFPNLAFYNGILEPVPTAHQKAVLDFIEDKSDSINELITSNRMAFIPSLRHKEDINDRSSLYEAKIVATLVYKTYLLYERNKIPFNSQESIGVITPFRSQIALIKREIGRFNIETLKEITVDTVERYQGSQRNTIIFSLSISSFGQLERLTSESIEYEGHLIDRKLNVALTRARKQLFITGQPQILCANLTYYKLIEYIRSKEHYINVHPEKFMQGDFHLGLLTKSENLRKEILEPEQTFAKVFNALVIEPIRADKRTNYPDVIYGHSNDRNRLEVIEYGRADFSTGAMGLTEKEKVNVYCYFNMRKHFFTSLAIFRSNKEFFLQEIERCNDRVTFIDIGCGPMTAGLAFNSEMRNNRRFIFNYLGVDTAVPMLVKAKEFSQSELFGPDDHFIYSEELSQSKANYKSWFILPNCVILNFCYLFGNLTIEQGLEMAGKVNELKKTFPLNKYLIIFQNTGLEQRNRSYRTFKKALLGVTGISDAKIETVNYKNSVDSPFVKKEDVFYEIITM